MEILHCYETAKSREKLVFSGVKDLARHLHKKRRRLQKKYMLWYTWVFLVIALLAAVLGFGGVAAAAAGIAKICFVVFLVLFVISLLAGRRSVI